MIAAQIGQETPFPSLELATEDFTGSIGACAPGYSCAYMNTISWPTPTTPLPMEINPRVVFERMFGRAGTASAARGAAAAAASILDSVGDELQSLQSRLGARDRRRLGEYLDNVREIERGSSRPRRRARRASPSPDAPVGIPESFEEHVALMFDLLALAYQADLTRVFTFMMSRELSQLTYPQIGVTEPHHSDVAPRQQPRADGEDGAHQHVPHAAVRRFLEKLRATPDGDGSLLDHSMIFYGSGMANSDNHAHLDLPLTVVGGQFKGNRHLRFEGPPMANLWLTVAATFGRAARELRRSAPGARALSS